MASDKQTEKSLPPMTPEQLEAEAAFADKVYREYKNMSLDAFREKLKHGKQSRAANLLTSHNSSKKKL